MVLHQAGEVLHCDETGVLWVQLENKNNIKLSECGINHRNADNSCTQDVSVMRRDFLISSAAELKCQFTLRDNATVKTAEMYTQRNKWDSLKTIESYRSDTDTRVNLAVLPLWCLWKNNTCFKNKILIQPH